MEAHDGHRKYTNLAAELKLHDKDPNHSNEFLDIWLIPNAPRKSHAKYELNTSENKGATEALL